MSKDLQPVMVLNLYTEKIMNVEPLFNFLKYDLNPAESEQLVDDSIRLLTVYANQETFNRERISIIHQLYLLRDMFRRIGEVEMSMPKRKGASNEE